MRNNYDVPKIINIGLLSIASCKVIALNILCFFSLLISSFKVIALTTIAIGIHSSLRGDRKKDYCYFALTPLRA